MLYAHGGDVRAANHGSRVTRWVASRIVRSAAAVVANSAETARDVERLGGTAAIIPPGIELARFGPTPRPSERRVLYLGGDVAEKGIAVARDLADTLVGPGLRELDPAEVPALMASHDVVLVPSVREPYGLVAAEAIASGRWVVAAAVGGLMEIVTDGVNGTLVEDGEFEAALVGRA